MTRPPPCVAAPRVALKPPSLSHTDAASLPLAGVTALQALERGGVKAGDKVFISGGAGGVGSLAIQIAKNVMGAAVVATTASPGPGTELVQAMGADVVVDYRKEDFSKVLSDYGKSTGIRWTLSKG